LSWGFDAGNALHRSAWKIGQNAFEGHKNAMAGETSLSYCQGFQYSPTLRSAAIEVGHLIEGVTDWQLVSGRGNLLRHTPFRWMCTYNSQALQALFI